jgi:mannose-6-phosphate isomerase-like protein (cupin superfamily)
MARAGETINNPVTGERLTWRQVAADTDGRLVLGEMVLPPGGFVTAEHVHPKQEERYEILAGRLNVRVDGRAQVLGPGDRVLVPAGRPHVWRNAGSEEVRFRVEVTPALRFETFIETLFGLASDGKTDARGMPNPLQVAVLMRAYQDELRLARPAPAVQSLMFGPLAIVGRLMGYRSSYPRYSEGPDRPADGVATG